MNTGIWRVLGIERTDDVRAIKRAYAQQLKKNRPDDDPSAFQALRNAYERALAYAEQQAKREDEIETETEIESCVSPVSNDMEKSVLRSHVAMITLVNDDAVEQSLDLGNTSIDDRLLLLTTELSKASTSQSSPGNVAHLIQLFDHHMAQAQLSFAEREQWEVRLLIFLSREESLPLALTLHIAHYFEWNKGDVRDALFRLVPDAAGPIFFKLCAEWERQIWDQRAQQNVMTARVLLLLTRNNTRWQRISTRLSAHTLRHISDVIYLMAATTPHFWAQMKDQPNVRYWSSQIERADQAQLFNTNEFAVSFGCGLAGFAAQIRSQGGAGGDPVAAMLLGLAIAFSLAGTFFCLNFGARKLSSVLVGNSGLSISLLIAMSAMWFVSTLSLLTGELQIVLAMSLLYISLIKAELWSQLWGHVRRTWFWLALLLAWSIALAVNAKITDGAAALALVVTVVTLLIVLQTELAFVASVFGNLLNQSKQKTAMLLALLMFVLGLVVVNPHSVFFASLLLFLTVLSYSIWQPPQTPYNNKIRVAVMLTLYLALKLVAFDKSVMSTLMYFAWISFVATVGSNGAIVLFSLLNHQRMIRR